jgi:glycosyltransferase involved in cell wall biosynthesis
MPMAIEKFILKDYDLILSSSHCVAKGVIPGPETPHISYVHSPMRYVWDMHKEYFGKGKAGKLTRLIISFFAPYLRMWDVASSARVDHFIANSAYVAKRIKKYYRRDSEVIHPPVDFDKFKISNEIDDYYLMLTAFAPYKRVDLGIEAFNKLGYKLKIVGNGQDERKLQEMAGTNIEFLGWQPDEVIPELYSRCKAFIFPGEDDFGITPLESMASGRPVIAFGKGGALETVNGLDSNNPTGIFFYEQNAESLIKAIKDYEKNTKMFAPDKIKKHAERWSNERFISEFRSLINEHMK